MLNQQFCHFLMRRLMIIMSGPCQFCQSTKEIPRKIVCLVSFKWQTIFISAYVCLFQQEEKLGSETIGHS